MKFVQMGHFKSTLIHKNLICMKLQWRACHVKRGTPALLSQ